KHVTILLGSFLGVALFWLGAAVGSAQDAGAKEIDPKVIEAWKRAGAQVGWSSDGHFLTTPSGRDLLPGFCWTRFETGSIVELLGSHPAPALPFGLVLRESGITDAGLKEVARLANLHHLGLYNTPVTDVGMKELAGLKNLRTLDLGFTKVTDV